LVINMVSSDYTGAINTDGAAGNVVVFLDDDSTWILTGDSYITRFEGDMSNVITNGYKLITE
ncbi:MAG: hypothetical protein K6A23_06090, partial [Butyrivibrio sp.]|nr:hypothetical protein [Butyrivibrio sp.]